MLATSLSVETLVEWYIEQTYKELKRLKFEKYTGNVNFKFNFKEGKLANVNVDTSKSLRCPHENLV